MKEEVTTKLTDPCKRLLGMVFQGNYTEGSLDELISAITSDAKIQATLKKRLKGRWEKDTAALMKVAGLSEQEASDYAYMAVEVINWEWLAQVLKSAGWAGSIQEAIEVIRAAVIVDESMHIFSNVPNLTDENFGGNLSGVAVSYKLWGIEQICAIKERKFKRGLQRRIELITNMLNLMGGNYDYRDIDIQFRRNKPQNLLEIAQIIQMLADLLSKESRLKMLPDVDNPRDELDKLRDEQQKEMSSFGASGYEMLAKALQTAQEPTPAAGEPKEAVNE